MAQKRRRLDRQWVCRHVGVLQGTEGTVETLTLQGTHKGKIFSLGDAFKYFKSLRCLDLSRNVLSTLKGIEYLHALQFLNLYYNDITSVAEIRRLSSLKQLQALDLRLNPVTKQEEDYRHTVVHMLPGLQTLDDRTVRESERNATFPFRPKQYEARETSAKEAQRENTAQGEGLGGISPNKGLSDLQTKGPTDMKKGTQNLEPKDGLRGRSSPSRATLLEGRQNSKEPDQLEDEYRPLPSPTRSSLRSPGKGSSLRAKEGFRVTFADNSLDSLPQKEMSAKHLERDDNLGSAKKPIYDSTEKPGAFFTYRDAHVTSAPLKKESVASQEWTHGGEVYSLGGNTAENGKDSSKPSYTMETSSERLLRLSSDLYVATHLNDPPAPSDPSYAWRKGLGNITKSYTLPSKPSMANPSLYTTKPESRPESRDYKAWEYQRGFGSGFQNTAKAQNGMKRSSSLNSLLPPTPIKAHSDRYASDTLLTDHGVVGRDGSAGSEEASITDVLQQLLDLVDRYWNGSGSLIQNLKFMVPARELLSRLMKSSVPRTSHYEKDHLLHDRSKADEFQATHGHADEHDGIESLKKKLRNVMEENSVLKSKLYRLENSAIPRESAGSQHYSQGDLAQKYEKLSSQLEFLQQQLKQSHNLQDTMNLLHDSQRSLLSTNEYLLQQLNKLSSNTTSITSTAPSKPRSTADKLYYSDLNALSSSPYSDLNALSSSPSALTSGQYRKPERLSQCPL